MLTQDSYSRREERVIRSAGTGAGYYAEVLLTAVILVPITFILFSLFVSLLQAVISFPALIGGTPVLPGWFLSLFSWLPAAVAVYLVGALIYLFLRAATVKYVLTNQRLVTSRGLLTHTAEITPLDRIQDVSLHRPFLGLLFGYGFVRVETAGTHGQVTLRYVSKPTEWAQMIDESARAFRAQPQTAVPAGSPPQPLVSEL